MDHTFTVHVTADTLPDKEKEKMAKALQRAMKKWFLKGYDVKVE